MKSKIFKLGLLIIAMCFVIGCGKDDDEPETHPIVGTWNYSIGEAIICNAFFASDNTYSIEVSGDKIDAFITISGTYKINGNKIIFTTTYISHPDKVTIFADESFFEIGRDSNGDYLIVYNSEEDKENADKYRRVNKK